LVLLIYVTPRDIIDFWYSARISPRWFASTPELDAEIRQRYAGLWEQAARGELDTWQATAEGSLALAIVLDQFPLNMFRGTPRSFSTEARAVAVALQAVHQRQDQQLPVKRRAFLYMPLMHSEDSAHQARSVQLFDQPGLEEHLKFARHHQKLIQEFGRFPHRNPILGRPSTPAEITYLNSSRAFKG
jgi:uncharacterized protein (DUF924 family)